MIVSVGHLCFELTCVRNSLFVYNSIQNSVLLHCRPFSSFAKGLIVREIGRKVRNVYSAGLTYDYEVSLSPLPAPPPLYGFYIQTGQGIPVRNHDLRSRFTQTLVLTHGGQDPDPVIRERRDFVKRMMKDAWDDYTRYAWGENELKPVSQTGQSGGIFGETKIGATIVDSLDTLYIMDLMEEFDLGTEWVAKNLNFEGIDANVSVFETNIRFMGGLLTAFALTGNELFKEKALQLGHKLLPAFDSPTGIPYGYINLLTGEPEHPDGSSNLAEIGTLHLEFHYLSQITGNPIFAQKVDKIRAALVKVDKPNGLYSSYISPITGEFTSDDVSMGGGGDSFYEYLLKAAIMLDDTQAREMYDAAMEAFISNDLVRTSSQSHLLYIAQKRGSEIEDVVGHLACFAGGMFALGATTDPRPTGYNQKNRDMEIGRNFTNTCHESYIRSDTEIGPELFRFSDTLEATTDVQSEKAYVLRPEVIESYFVLYRLTGEVKYRDWGWEAAQAIEKYTKVGPGRGYSGIRDVYSLNPEYDDVQQTFFLAETLKYLYLLFSTNDLISLDQWVFNTECHPLPIKG